MTSTISHNWAAVDYMVEEVTVADNFSQSSGSNSVKTATVPTYDGYTPVAVVGWFISGTNNSRYDCTRCYLDGNTVTMMVGASSYSLSNALLRATILYVKQGGSS